MSKYLASAAFYDQIISLDEEDRQAPIRVIERFFADYRLHECRHILRTMVEACLTTDNSDYSEPEERADLLTQYKSFEMLLEACFLLTEKGAGRE